VLNDFLVEKVRVDIEPHKVLGTCKTCVITNNSTLFIGTSAEKSKLKERYLYLQSFWNS